MNFNAKPKTSRHSLFENRSYWYIAAKSTALRSKPIRVMLWGDPIVLFRDSHGSAHGVGESERLPELISTMHEREHIDDAWPACVPSIDPATVSGEAEVSRSVG